MTTLKAEPTPKHPRKTRSFLIGAAFIITAHIASGFHAAYLSNGFGFVDMDLIAVADPYNMRAWLFLTGVAGCAAFTVLAFIIQFLFFLVPKSLRKMTTKAAGATP